MCLLYKNKFVKNLSSSETIKICNNCNKYTDNFKFISCNKIIKFCPNNFKNIGSINYFI